MEGNANVTRKILRVRYRPKGKAYAFLVDDSENTDGAKQGADIFMHYSDCHGFVQNNEGVIADVFTEQTDQGVTRRTARNAASVTMAMLAADARAATAEHAWVELRRKLEDVDARLRAAELVLGAPPPPPLARAHRLGDGCDGVNPSEQAPGPNTPPNTPPKLFCPDPNTSFARDEQKL